MPLRCLQVQATESELLELLTKIFLHRAATTWSLLITTLKVSVEDFKHKFRMLCFLFIPISICIKIYLNCTSFIWTRLNRGAYACSVLVFCLSVHVSVKKTTAAPRTLAGQIKAGSFLSSSARFAPPRDVLIKESDPLVPGECSNVLWVVRQLNQILNF